MKSVRLVEMVGSFAENKDLARDIRIKEITPALVRGDEVVLDFAGVDSATQSFIHALISELMRRQGAEVLDRIVFKNCGESVKGVISIVTRYMQESD